MGGRSKPGQNVRLKTFKVKKHPPSKDKLTRIGTNDEIVSNQLPQLAIESNPEGRL
jgi:hypothetical protein